MAQPHFLQTLQRHTSNPLLTIDDITWDFKKKRSIMFPSVIDMSGKLDNPIDRYYMYLASHGGREIGFATAPTLEGPWTMQKEAVLHLDNCPAIRGHLSSPEIIYYNNRFILYYHGGCPPEVLEEQTAECPPTIIAAFKTQAQPPQPMASTLMYIPTTSSCPSPHPIIGVRPPTCICASCPQKTDATASS